MGSLMYGYSKFLCEKKDFDREPMKRSQYGTKMASLVLSLQLLEQPDNKECSSIEVINALTSFSMSLWDSMFLILELLRT